MLQPQEIRSHLCFKNPIYGAELKVPETGAGTGIGYRLSRSQSVTAPSEADLTWLAYFASTPLV